MLRLATQDDLGEIAGLYRETILAINIKDYNRRQVNAWAGRWTNLPGWKSKIADQYFLLDIRDGQIAGYCSLTPGGHVDMLFVHKDHQGKGIARQLVTAIIAEANCRGMERLTADVSLTARRVFELMGFSVVTPQTVVVDGVKLNNFKMSKQLHENSNL